MKLIIHYSQFARKSLTSIIIGKLLSVMQCVNKGHLILKCLFSVFNFSKKNEENKST